MSPFPTQTRGPTPCPLFATPQALNLPHGDARIRHVMTKYDADQSGSVDLAEFTHYMMVGGCVLDGVVLISQYSVCHENVYQVITYSNHNIHAQRTNPEPSDLRQGRCYRSHLNTYAQTGCPLALWRTTVVGVQRTRRFLGLPT